jgi:hypothetical protein
MCASGQMIVKKNLTESNACLEKILHQSCESYGNALKDRRSINLKTA